MLALRLCLCHSFCGGEPGCEVRRFLRVSQEVFCFSSPAPGGVAGSFPKAGAKLGRVFEFARGGREDFGDFLKMGRIWLCMSGCWERLLMGVKEEVKQQSWG